MNKLTMLTLLICLGIFCPLWAQVDDFVPLEAPDEGYQILHNKEWRQLDEMLSSKGFSRSSLAFERDWDLSTAEKSAWHMDNLKDPEAFLNQAAELRELLSEASGDNLARLWAHFGYVNWDQKTSDAVYQAAREEYLIRYHRSVKKPADIFVFWEKVLSELIPNMNQAFAGLGSAQLDSLSSYFFRSAVEEDDKDKYQAFFAAAGLPEIDKLDKEDLQRYFEAIDAARMLESGLKYLAACKVLASELPQLKFNNNKLLMHKSAHGLMVIGTLKDDIYTDTGLRTNKNGPLCLIIDPSGSDRYEMQLNTGSKNSSYFLLDIAGDDLYRSQEPATMFFSNRGHGVSMDLKGNDLYQTDDFGFAAMLGTNLHLDSEGDDIYRCGMFSQGAAAEGISILADMQGTDTYQATTLAQGMGFIRGSGALLDLSGADNYLLGNKYYHAPLMPNDFRSMGQGMGFGARPDFAGGLGLLYDQAGNDHYLGGVYAQGVGYWYATGMLLDEAGNDVYNAIYYPQGSGIHLACGMLYDGGGDDAYYSRNGPGQGAGHDWAMGMLIDADGNDAYSIHGGNGLGLSNSVGIFVDKKGKDRYERQEAQNYGNAAYSRLTGGLGLFLDTNGEDSYPDSVMANDKTWEKGSYGMGRDVDIYPEEEVAAAAEPSDEPLVAADAPIADIFAAASEWEVGSAIKRVKAARITLKERASEALEYITKNKLDSQSGLEYRALEAFLDDNDAFKIRLFEFVEDTDSLKAKNAMSLIAGIGDSTLIVPIRHHLEAKRYITACISLLGSIKSSESVAILSGYVSHSSERYRYLAARSLSQIKTPEAKAALDSMKDDKSFLVQALLRNLPKEEK